VLHASGLNNSSALNAIRNEINSDFLFDICKVQMYLVNFFYKRNRVVLGTLGT